MILLRASTSFCVDMCCFHRCTHRSGICGSYENCLVFWGSSTVSSKAAVPFAPHQWCMNPPFLHVPTSMPIYSNSHLGGCQRCLSVVWVCMWSLFSVPLRRVCVLLLLGVCFTHLLGPVDLCCSSFLFPHDLVLSCSIRYWKSGIEISIIVELSISSFNSVIFLL